MTKWRVLTSTVAFVRRSKHFAFWIAQKILLHLCEEDTFLFLLVGKLWSKAVYQGVIFESEVLLFFVREKWAK